MVLKLIIWFKMAVQHARTLRHSNAWAAVALSTDDDELIDA